MLQVEDIPVKLQDMNSLTMFFQNTRRSGGGQINHVQFTSPDKTTARITFKEPPGKLPFRLVESLEVVSQDSDI